MTCWNKNCWYNRARIQWLWQSKWRLQCQGWSSKMKSLMSKNAMNVNLLHKLSALLCKEKYNFLLTCAYTTAVAFSNSIGEIQSYNIYSSISTMHTKFNKICQVFFQITRVFIYLIDKIEWYSLTKNDVNVEIKY